MPLIYKFKKEKLDDGGYVSRPKILVRLSGESFTMDVVALLDTGCDITVIPENLAKALGLKMTGKKEKLFGFRESSEAIKSSLNVSFLGKEDRQTEKLNNVPVLVVLQNKGDENEDMVLGIERIFDEFEITLKKHKNEIILKRVANTNN